MKAEFSPELRAELLDDFYAECDEHLSNLRAQIARLEAAQDRDASDPAALESLYRSVHSFKGNASIVGLTSAETLAHAAEGLLRSLTRGETALTAPLLDLVGQVGHRLEQIVSAFRLQQPLPDIAALLAPLEPYSPLPVASMIPPPASRVLPDLADAAGMRWRATFAPSAELDARGVNVNAVRARLAALGRIISAEPAVLPGGRMIFTFMLTLREAPNDLAAWAADGIVLSNDDDPAPLEPVAEPGAGGMFIAPSHIVRVDLGRLDDLMRIVGELVIHRSRLEERITRLKGDRSSLQEVTLGLGRSLRELREAITRVRLVPVGEIFGRLPFVVRDLERDTDKQVRLLLEGQETEIDKYLVERLKEPLLHLVRNAVSHGIENPSERAAAGKAAAATLRLRATAVGDSVVIKIRDDGRGINEEHVAERARAAGLAVPATLDGPALLDLICTPGFSTREEADRASGRGVGMSVVASTVRELGGTLTLETSPAEGTEFTLRLPLTLSIAETFVVSAGPQICAVPQGFIDEVIQVETAGIQVIKGVEVAPYRDGVLPLLRLRSLFGLERTTAAQLPVLVIGSERGAIGLAVDRVHGQREVVVRPMSDPLIRVPGVSGATELGDGRPVLILDAATLTAGAVRPRSGAGLPVFHRRLSA